MNHIPQFFGGPFDNDEDIPEAVTHIHVQIHYADPRDGLPDRPARIIRGIYERDECGLFVWSPGASLTMEDPTLPVDKGISGIAMGTDRKPTANQAQEP